MESSIELVKRVNNWDVESKPTQLTMGLTGGGGKFTSILRHGKSDSLTFSDICSTETLFAAWGKFRRGKGSRLDVLSYERHLEENIFELQSRLESNRYQHGKYLPFTIYDPKQRQIHKATVEDRLVHQAITTAIEPIFERQFIYDSYSCRKSKGTHVAVLRLKTFLRCASKNNTATVYVLKCDIKQFFASVDRSLLLDQLSRRINDDRTLELINQIINSFSTSSAKGVPLGNLTSQLFANVYMHELDWFIKQTLRERYYLRYCDDFLIVSRDRSHLLSLIEAISCFLEQALLLKLHPNKVEVRSWHQGIDFLGYVLKPNCIVLRTKTKCRMIQRVDSTNLVAYLGLCSHANCYEVGRTLQNKAAY